MQISTVKKWFNIALIVTFCGFIFSPSVNMLFTEQLEISKNENRLLAKKPLLPGNILEVKSYFSTIDTYLNDHFGYREHYIYRYQREMKKHFNQFSLRDRVIHGLDGWLFFNVFNLIKDFLGLIPLSENDINTWIKETDDKASWLQSQGIRYIFMVAPNKQTIYPQYVMKQALLKKGTSRFEQVLQKLGAPLPSYMLNLHPFIKNKAKDEVLYYRSDTHWNHKGSYFAFQRLMERIEQWYPHEDFITDFSFQDDVTGPGGDLAHLIGRGDLTETSPQLKKIRECGPYNLVLPYSLSDVIQTPERRSFIRTCPTQRLKVLVFRDSFFNQIEPLLSQNFAEILYLWKDYDQQNVIEILEYFKPDIVIEEIVERHMFDQLLGNKE